MLYFNIILFSYFLQFLFGMLFTIIHDIIVFSIFYKTGTVGCKIFTQSAALGVLFDRP